MDDANTGLQRQLAELRDLRQNGNDQEGAISISPLGGTTETSPRIDPGAPSRADGTEWGAQKGLCRHCRGLDLSNGRGGYGDKTNERYSQLFLP